MTVVEAIRFLETQVEDPRVGLPDDIFYFLTRLTPMINVDLLVKDCEGRCLLSWRDDEFTGTGWHVPGGIVRSKEPIEQRIVKVAESEIGAEISFDPKPIAINQIIAPHATRGHFISLLYSCSIKNSAEIRNDGRSEGDVGYIAWHETCPDNLVKYQDIYREFIE